MSKINDALIAGEEAGYDVYGNGTDPLKWLEKYVRREGLGGGSEALPDTREGTLPSDNNNQDTGE